MSAGLILTVIYPLHFIPIAINNVPSIGFSFEIIISHIFSLRGFLLIILTLTIETILIYFVTLTINLERKYATIVNDIDPDWLDKKYYSKYFE